jgi:ornithine decarboxylase
MLAQAGAKFDVASDDEIRRCLEEGVSADRLSFRNTIKRESEIAHTGLGSIFSRWTARLGLKTRAALGAQVFCRILVAAASAEWPLIRKFGCTPAMAADLLFRAERVRLRPIGVSFHVG